MLDNLQYEAERARLMQQIVKRQKAERVLTAIVLVCAVALGAWVAGLALTSETAMGIYDWIDGVGTR